MINAVFLIAPNFTTCLPKGTAKSEFFIKSQSDLRVLQLKRVIAIQVGLISSDTDLWPSLLDEFSLRLMIGVPTSEDTSCYLQSSVSLLNDTQSFSLLERHFSLKKGQTFVLIEKNEETRF